jgi:hypothetical protein
LHDAIALEKAGVPTVAVITSAFVDAAALMARVCGMPRYEFAVVEHPISSAKVDELANKAQQALVQAERLLLV